MPTVDSNDKQEESPVIKIPSNQMDNQVKRISRSSKDSSSDNKQDDSQTSSLQLIDLQSQKSNEISEPNGSINKFEPSSKDSSSDNKQDDSQTSNSQFQQVQKRRGRPSLLQKRREGSLALDTKQDDSQTSSANDSRPNLFLQKKREGSLPSTASNLALLPKKRGRPFKYLSLQHSTNKNLPTSSKEPKKRGRPFSKPKTSLNFNPISLQSQIPKRGRPPLLFNLKRRKAGLTSSTSSNPEALPKKRGRPFKYLSLKHSTNKSLPTSSKEPKKRGRKPRLAEDTTIAQ
ncbi:hypothetical protein M3Y97_00901400 [Aphelenchoides bicaudatus]|nr:hypothetical protein M3Y97_00901400 [Aphelenchoides bicaudatus]